jgi:hypothetical protein
VAGLIGLDRIVAAQAWRWDTYDPQPCRERLATCRQGRWDLLIVGGSPAMYGIDPAILTGTPWRGKPIASGFNFGLPLGTMTEARFAAAHGPPVPPRLLIYGATATDFNESRRSADGPRRLMTVADLASAATSRSQPAGWFAWNFGSEAVARSWRLYYHRRGIRLCLAGATSRVWPNLFPAEAAEAARGKGITQELRSANGFPPPPPVTRDRRLDALKADGRITDYFPFMDDYRVGAGYLADLDRMLGTAAGQGTTVVLVDMPVPADLDGRLYPNQFAVYRSALAEVASAHGVPVLQATRAAVGLTDADFCDLVHLNGTGAVKLSHWLRTAVAAAGEAAP